MKVTTCIEKNPKSKISLGGNLIRFIPVVELAIWSMFFSFKEETRDCIDHASIKIGMSNDGHVPCSVSIKIKIKGSNDVYSFERANTTLFHNFGNDYEKLGEEIKVKMKAVTTDLFQDVISGIGVVANEMKKLL